MTLGEWLNQVILDDEAVADDAPRYPSFGRQATPPQRRFESAIRPVEDAFRVTDTLDRLSARIEAAEQRSAIAIGGIEQSVAHLVARLEGAEHDQNAVVSRFEGAVDGLRAEQARAGERLRRFEQEAAETRVGEALKSLEGALSKLAGHVYAGEGQAKDSFDGLRQELDGVHERLGGAFSETAARELVEGVIARLSGRLEQAELRTTDALRSLEGAFAELDARISATEQRLADGGQEARLEALAASLTERMDAVRAEMAENIRASAADGRFERMEQALQEISGHVRTAEQRSAGAIEKMGHEVLRMADTLTRSVQESEQRSGQAIETVKQAFSGEVARVADGFARNVEAAERRSAEAIERVGGDVARVADAMEARLTQADAVGAQALERLGAEITRISERLTERIANAERRSAQAIDDVGDQVARATERMQDRQERVSGELADRIRQSEERTARFLDEARERIDHRLAETQRRLADVAPAEAHALSAYSTYADPAVAPFGDDSFAAPAEDFAREAPPVFGHAEPSHGLLQAEPEAGFEPEAEVAATQGDDAELFGAPAAPAEDDPFGDDGFMEPARVAAEREDFGAGLFTEPQRSRDEIEPEVDDDWLSPVADEAALHGAHAEDDAEPIAPFGLARPDVADEDQAHLEPHADDGFEAADEFVAAESERPKTTRELIEQARAAARAASQPQDAKARAGETRGGSMFSGFGLGGGRKKRGGSTMRTALLVSGGTAAMGVALAGYVILADKPHGALPDRVAEALGVHAAAGTHPAAGEMSPNPLAAVALAPKPIAGQAVDANQTAALPTPEAAGGAELYNDAVRKIEAKDKSGVAPLQKAANIGYAPAQFYLAKLYEDGQAGLPKDLVEARRWTERAAEGGDRKAMHNLALYFFEGVGGPKNLTSAAQWFRRASDLGLVDSQYNLARLYEEGFGVAQNPAEAYKWYLIAGRSGDAESRMSALRIKSQLSAEAQSAAERAAQGFQSQPPDPTGAPLQAAVGGDAASVATAQRALTKLGFYLGPTDGTPSPALKLAIAAYQRGQGLPSTGQLDPGLTQRLATVVQP
ncbi:MAG: peptidoglycan-binding protein [Caulobacteraceae bacterium]|nr:peptidoglycan-binding protein [Caulobacteraceae bacterium]